MAIAAILNRSGKLTGHGATWTRTNVRGLRNTNGIPIYREGERAERGEIMLDEAADLRKEAEPRPTEWSSPACFQPSSCAPGHPG